MNFFCIYSLKAMRVKVWRARSDSPLFDCKQYAQGMEGLYYRMWDRYSHGEKPDHLTKVTTSITNSTCTPAISK